MKALEIEKLNKKFGEQTVLNDVSFSVEEHSIFGFLGQNGAGKTTTMKIILGLLKADSGSITVCGEQVHYGETGTNQFIGFLPDVPEFYGYMKPKEYLKLCGEITGISANEIKVRTEELLQLVGLAGVNKKISGFSRGMKQRLGIAQALLNEPKLLICDEPTSALDPLGRKEILDILHRVKDKTTVLFSTHILSDAERICDNVAILSQGSLVLNGTLEQIKSNKKSEKLMIEFQNKSDMNKFLELEHKNCEIESNNFSVTITAHNIFEIEKAVIAILHKENLQPNKIEVLEPTLESLFLEAIK